MNLRFFYTWHRRFGIFIAVFVLILVVTGFALNHTESLELDNKFITSEWLLDVYKIEVKGSVLAFSVAEQSIVQLDDHLYFNDKEIRTGITQLIGSVLSNGYIVISLEKEMILVDSSGEVLEIITSVDGMPAGVKAIGLSRQKEIILNAEYGFYQVDLDELYWQEVTNDEDILWSKPTVINKELYKKISEHYRGKGLTIERVIQDIHSGRIFGQTGVIFVDLIGILLTVLIFSGFYMWFKRF